VYPNPWSTYDEARFIDVAADAATYEEDARFGTFVDIGREGLRDGVLIGGYRRDVDVGGVVLNAGLGHHYDETGNVLVFDTATDGGADRIINGYFGWDGALDRQSLNCIFGAYGEDGRNVGTPAAAGVVHPRYNAGGAWVNGAPTGYTPSTAIANDGWGAGVCISGDGTRVGMSCIEGSRIAVATISPLAVMAEEQIITPSGSPADVGQTRNLKMNLDGDIFVVGDHVAQKVWTFTRVGTTWSEVDVMTVAGGTYATEVVVSDDGTRLFVGDRTGAPSGGGQLYHYTRDGTGWSLVEIVVPSGSSSTDNFAGRGAVGIAPSGTTVAIGAAGDDTIATNQGKVYIFRIEGGLLVEKQAITATTVYGPALFGSAVACDDEMIVVGGSGDDHNNPGVTDNAGAVWSFVATSPFV